MARWWRSATNNLRTVVVWSQPPPSSSSAGYHTIQAIPREISGSRVSSKDRAQGRIPAVVLSQHLIQKGTPNTSQSMSRKHLVTTERKQIQAILKSVQLPFFCSTTFPLQIRAGSGSSHLLESGTVLPIKVTFFWLIFLLFLLFYIYNLLISFIVWGVTRFIGTKRVGRYWIWCLFGLKKGQSWRLMCPLFSKEKMFVLVLRKVILLYLLHIMFWCLWLWYYNMMQYIRNRLELYAIH